VACFKAVSALVALVLMSNVASAQISTDGSVGPARSLSGPEFAITDDLGRRAGQNLFHSFRSFSVPAGARATFSGPADIRNLVGRVTGGISSTIDGAIRSTIAGANLYLINPAGMFFGPGASLEIDGAFHASTADAIRFPDGTLFSARDPSGSIFSIAKPESFGFLGDSLSASLSVAGATLAVGADDALSLSGGAVNIVGGVVAAAELALAAVGPGGTFAPEAAGAAGPAAFVPGDSITILQGQIFSNGGIDFQGGSIILDGARVANARASAAIGDGIAMRANDTIAVKNDTVVLDRSQTVPGGGIRLAAPFVEVTNALVQSEALGSEPGGDINVTAGEFSVLAGGDVLSFAVADGPGGNITIDAIASLSIDGLGADGFGGQISTVSTNGATGPAGTVSARSPIVAIDGGAINSLSFGTGATGAVGVIGDAVSLVNGGAIGTTALGVGDAGNVVVRGTQRVDIVGADATGLPSRINSRAAQGGNTGAVGIVGGTVTIDGGAVSASSTLDGDAGDIVFEVDNLLMSGGANVFANNSGNGRGAVIIIRADTRVELVSDFENDRVTSLFNDTVGDGDGGALSVETPLFQSRGGFVSSSTVAPQGLGDAGGIIMKVGRLELTDGATLVSTSRSLGRGGNITIDASEQVFVGDRGRGQFPASISSDTGNGSTLQGGVVTITTPLMALAGGQLSSTSFGDSGAGRITLFVERLDMTAGASIVTDAFAAGDGGEIEVLASDRARIVGDGTVFGSVVTSRALPGSTGDAGRITILTPLIDLDGGLISAESFAAGQAGRVGLLADRILISNAGSVESNSFGAGAGGDVDVEAKVELRVTSARDASDLARSRITSTTAGGGAAGDVSIDAPVIVLDGRSFVTAEGAGSADAGRVEILGAFLSVLNGARITSDTENGRGGDIAIELSRLLQLSGTDANGIPSVVSTSSFGAGNGGTIAVTAPKIEMRGSVIIAIGIGTGNAGDIIVKASDTFDAVNAAVSTQAENAEGGDITFEVGRLFALKGSSVTTSVQSGAGDGGNIAIDPIFVVLRDSRIEANAFGGNGGNISIVADNFLADEASVVRASSALGIDGDVLIDTLDGDVTSGLTKLPGGFLEAAAKLAQQCNARGGQTRASLTAAGRGALPSGPGGYMNAAVMVPTRPLAKPRAATGNLPFDIGKVAVLSTPTGSGPAIVIRCAGSGTKPVAG
jgi:filamentous hemagglutinin family protein